MKLRILVLLLIAAIMGAALADTVVYKWVDKNGNVHYSTVPQSPNAQATDIINTGRDQSPSASSASSASSTNQMPVVSPDDSAACKTAKQELGKYLMADTLFTMDAKGNKTPLPKDKQAQVVQQARNQMTIACSQPGTPP